MNTTLEEKNGKQGIRFGKKLTIYEISDIKVEIIKILNEKSDIIIDLGAVEECDTAGIQILVSIAKTAEKIKHTVYIENISGAVAQMATRLGVDIDESLNKGGVSCQE